MEAEELPGIVNLFIVFSLNLSLWQNIKHYILKAAYSLFFNIFLQLVLFFYDISTLTCRWYFCMIVVVVGVSLKK